MVSTRLLKNGVLEALTYNFQLQRNLYLTTADAVTIEVYRQHSGNVLLAAGWEVTRVTCTLL